MKNGDKKPSILEVRGLSVAADGKEILHQITLNIGQGEVVVLAGPNGAGKSTLGAVTMGMPNFSLSAGEIWFDGKNVTTLPLNERAKMGIFATFQEPVEVPGITTREMLKTAAGKVTDAELTAASKKVGLDIFATTRELNVGFSGGEKKKNEILQMLVLKPRLVILDEIDSGLDIDAAKQISKVLAEYQSETGASFMVITHNMRILQELSPSRTLVMVGGRIVHEGDGELAKRISKDGFAEFED